MKTHISLNVSNVSESVEFYKKMLGVEPFKLKADYAKFDVANGRNENRLLLCFARQDLGRRSGRK